VPRRSSLIKRPTRAIVCIHENVSANENESPVVKVKADMSEELTNKSLSPNLAMDVISMQIEA
jgi:hypothetical protein